MFLCDGKIDDILQVLLWTQMAISVEILITTETVENAFLDENWLQRCESKDDPGGQTTCDYCEDYLHCTTLAVDSIQ
jgi:hypothetical protein